MTIGTAQRLPAAHAEALVLAKRAVAALAAAERAIRRFDALLENAGISPETPPREELNALLSELSGPAHPAGADSPPALPPIETTQEWWKSWWHTMHQVTRAEGEKAAQAGLGEGDNPYAAFEDPDGRKLAAIWRGGHRSIQRRRAPADIVREIRPGSSASQE